VRASDSKSGAAFLGSCHSRTRPSPRSEAGKADGQIRLPSRVEFVRRPRCERISIAFNLSLQIPHCHQLFAVSVCVCVCVCILILGFARQRKGVSPMFLKPHRTSPQTLPRPRPLLFSFFLAKLRCTLASLRKSQLYRAGHSHFNGATPVCRVSAG